ncbi:helix-turn-helix domain-containing protein [Vibrio mexicanus]|uniref:helix-turn-helix domain-containing protein n=1 Tax=Vibrio mexicanus TaxID=1004326 RepID=UPI00063C1AB3|nr:AraC family transcriptional regulator [Vibrio mexicanus]
MKPFKENVVTESNFDWLHREYECRVRKDEFTCSWHYHAEYELVLYLDPKHAFKGNYYAGDAIGPITHNSLLLYGPGLPHMLAGSFGSDDSEIVEDHQTIILWFSHQWLVRLQALIPEARQLKRLLENSAYGLSFSPETIAKVASTMKEMGPMSRQYQAAKVIEILVTLSDDHKVQKLASSPYYIKPPSEDTEHNQRIERASRYIEKHYGEPIKIVDVCKLLHISESSAYRLFEKHYGVSFSDHLKQYRVGKACELLASTQYPIALVAEKTGFNNLSNFNRQFKGLKDMTPTQFRRQFN